MTECPLCLAPETRLEHLSKHWLLCNNCGRKWRQDANIVTFADTNKVPPITVTAAVPR
jgi:hypothetical protein